MKTMPEQNPAEAYNAEGLPHIGPANQTDRLQPPNRADTRTVQAEPTSESPYLAARREWDERYGTFITRAKNWRMQAFVSDAIALVALGGLLVMVLRPQKIITVEIDRHGQYVGSSAATSFVPSEEMKRSVMADWVSNLRMVTGDGMTQRKAIFKVYGMISSGSAAQTFISDWYRNNPPQDRALTQTVHVDVNSVLSTSDKAYEAEWMETTRDLQGKVLSQKRYKGSFTFVISSPKDEQTLRLNPVGLYMTDARWSEVL